MSTVRDRVGRLLQQLARRRRRSRARAPAPRAPAPRRRPRCRRASASIGERADPERVVVELVGELERRARVLERSDEALPEARRPREPAVDDRLERRARGRLAQGLLEQRGGTIGALELGEEDEGLGAQRADLRLGQQVGRDRPGARPLPGGLMRAGRGQRPTMALVALVRRRQPERLLGELGRDGRRAAIGRQPRGVVEHAGDVGVRRVLRQREVTGAEERVVDDLRDPSRARSAAPRPGPGRGPTTAADG